MKRVCLLAALASCSSTKPPTRQPVTTQTASEMPQSTELSTRLIEGAPCAIRELGGVELATPVQRMVHGARVAALTHADEIVVRAAAVGATAAVITPDYSLVGDVDLPRQTIRPRDVVLDRWLGLREAKPGTVNADTMTLQLVLPRNVIPTRAPFIRLPCAALTLAKPPALPTDGKQTWLKPASKIALKSAPGGTVVATIETPRIDAGAADDPRRQFDIASLEARELARSGSSVRIRTGHTNYIEGWIDAALLGPAQPPTALAKPAGDAPKPKAKPMRCPHEIGIYVRTSKSEAIRVGTYKTGALINRHEDRKDEVPVDLGLLPKLPIEPLGGEPEVEPFVRASALANCAPQ